MQIFNFSKPQGVPRFYMRRTIGNLGSERSAVYGSGIGKRLDFRSRTHAKRLMKKSGRYVDIY